MMSNAVMYDAIVPPRKPWSHQVQRGQILRLIDVEGCQAVDFLAYNADDVSERYSAADTIVRQGNAYLNVGTVLYSNEGRAMMTLIHDTCGQHDTLLGACSCESNSVRYGHEARQQHSCVENFLLALSQYGMGKRDLVSNINFFMNVPINPNGDLAVVDGISQPGSQVDLRAEMNTLVVLSNCPQINNPCNAYNPSPIRVLILEGSE